MVRRFSHFPTEKIAIIKTNGTIIEGIDAFFSDNMFLIEDGELDIEENDTIQRSLPNGKSEKYLVIDRGFMRAIGSFPNHYQTRVKKIIDSPVSYNYTQNTGSSKLSFRDKAILEKLFDMGSGYVLNLSNSQFGALVAANSNIDVYSDPQYTSESSKAKKLRKFWNTESDSIVGRIILELLGIREDMIKSRLEYNPDYVDVDADNAIRLKRIAMSMVGESQMYENDSERFNADLSSANAVLQDLIWIGGRVCTNDAYNENSKEDTINDYFRDMLCSKGYNETKDQTRHGFSESGKGAGEVDILLTKDGKEIALFEGIIPRSSTDSRIGEHIDKAINNYNALGTATFIVAYVINADYGDFWRKYYNYISNHQYNMEIKKGITELTSPNASTKIAQIILSKDGFDFPVFFLCFKIRK